MDHHSHWVDAGGAAIGFHQAASAPVGTPGRPAASSHQGAPAAQQGWTAINSQATAGGGWGNSNCNNNSSSSSSSSLHNTNTAGPLEDAIDRFGSMTLGTGGSEVMTGQHQQAARGSEDARGMDTLDMGSLRVADEAGGVGSGFCRQQSQVQGNPFSRSGHAVPSQQMPARPTPDGTMVHWGTGQEGQRGGAPQGHAKRGGGCLCGGQGLDGGRGPDGVWYDEHGRRLYEEVEVREALEKEGREWRDRAVALEASLAKMEREAKEALGRAEHAVAEMAERLRASESKTYALSVHLAKSNRPSHLA